jgi:hypothetical protein
MGRVQAHMSRRSALLICVLALACGKEAVPAPQEVKPAAAAIDVRHAVFAKDQLAVAVLERPVPLPLVAGSVSAPDLITSSDASIGSIDGAGAFVAHRNGSVQLRSTTGGSVLRVVVRAVTVLTARPDAIVVQALGTAPVRVFADGTELDPAAVGWSTTEPGIAMAERGVIRAGATTGTAKLIANYGDRQAEISAKVEAPGKIEIDLRGNAGVLRVGGVTKLEVYGVPDLPLEWSSSRSAVLRSLGRGAFFAVAPGSSNLCVKAYSTSKCMTATVAR